MRRWIAVVVMSVAVSCFSVGLSVAPSGAEWYPPYERAVKNLTESQILTGYPDLKMRPAQFATRYEMAAIFSRLVRHFDVPVEEHEWLPEDVPWNHWAADACGIMAGSGVYPLERNANFHGDIPLERGVFAIACWRLVRRIGGEPAPRKGRNIDRPHDTAAKQLKD